MVNNYGWQMLEIHGQFFQGGQAVQVFTDHEPNTERGNIENKGGSVSNMPVLCALHFHFQQHHQIAHMESKGTSSVSFCIFLDKPSKQKVDFQLPSKGKFYRSFEVKSFSSFPFLVCSCIESVANKDILP
ncbi:hypothetical protein FF1_000417 [Malus domestica]